MDQRMEEKLGSPMRYLQMKPFQSLLKLTALPRAVKPNRWYSERKGQDWWENPSLTTESKNFMITLETRENKWKPSVFPFFLLVFWGWWNLGVRPGESIMAKSAFFGGA